jgi:hypothetical protein
MSYLVISFSHKNLDIKQREKLAFNSDEEKARFIRKLLEAATTSPCDHRADGRRRDTHDFRCTNDGA